MQLLQGPNGQVKLRVSSLLNNQRALREKQRGLPIMAKDEKMNRFNSKIAREAEKNKLIETAKRKVRPPRDKAMTEILQAGDEAYDEVRRETRGAVPKNPFKKGGFIKEAIKKPGALRKSLGVKKGEKIPAGKLAAAAKKPGKMGQRARLAQTLKGLKK
jgi:hypothetical protein